MKGLLSSQPHIAQSLNAPHASSAQHVRLTNQGPEKGWPSCVNRAEHQSCPVER